LPITREFFMKNMFLLISGSLFALLAGCAMFKSWQAIPPPGGCDQCHTIHQQELVSGLSGTHSSGRIKCGIFSDRSVQPSKSKPTSSIGVQAGRCEMLHDCLGL
jgi:hypothetical protein